MVLGDCISDWTEIDSGVPQGSVQGPILFVIFINDLPKYVKNSIWKLYADDNKLISKISSEQDCHNLQEDIDELEIWSEKWLLGFNFEKCKFMHIGKPNPNFDFQRNRMVQNKKLQKR